jgi:Mg-chelatase subunit ChlD
MTSQSFELEYKDTVELNQVVTDIIVVLDSSGSMDSMGNEPVQAVNIFMEEQK